MATFVSKFPFLNVNLTAERATTTPRGERIVLEHPTYAVFKNGRFTTNNPETIKMLEEHRSCGLEFHGPYNLDEDKMALKKPRITEVDPRAVLRKAYQDAHKVKVHEGARTTEDAPVIEKVSNDAIQESIANALAKAK